jgi:hypothetical protein
VLDIWLGCENKKCIQKFGWKVSLKIRIWEIILNWISGMVCEDVI